MFVLAKKRDRRDPVLPEWKARVRKELERGGRGAFTRLAAGIGCSTGKLGDLLSDDPERSPSTSPLVARVNAFYKWPAPVAPSAGRDAGELQHIFDRLDIEQRNALLDAAAVIAGMSGDDAQKALFSLLRITARPQK